jgi:hypothetical protein
MISGRQLAILHREHINRHCLKALTGRLRSPKFTCGCPGRFATYHDLVTESLDVLNCPVQIGDSRTNILKYLGQLIARQPVLIRMI